MWTVATFVLLAAASVHGQPQPGCPDPMTTPPGCVWVGAGCDGCTNQCLPSFGPGLDNLANSSSSLQMLEDSLVCAFTPVFLKMAVIQLQDLAAQMKQQMNQTRKLSAANVVDLIPHPEQFVGGLKKKLVGVVVGAAAHPSFGRALGDMSMVGGTNYTADQLMSFRSCVDATDLANLKAAVASLQQASGGAMSDQSFAELYGQFNETIAKCKTQDVSASQISVLSAYWSAAMNLGGPVGGDSGLPQDGGNSTGSDNMGSDPMSIIDSVFGGTSATDPTPGPLCLPATWDWTKASAQTTALNNLATTCMNATSGTSSCDDSDFSLPNDACASSMFAFMGISDSTGSAIINAAKAIAATCKPLAQSACTPSAAPSSQINALSAALTSAQSQANGTSTKSAAHRGGVAALVMLSVGAVLAVLI